MLFIFVCFLACASLSAFFALIFTRRRLNSDWRRAGPRPIASALRRRNRTLLIVLAGLLAVVALFEAIVPAIAYALQDLQENMSRSFPTWALVGVGNGSISWLLYLAVLSGVFAGLVFGTLRALRAFAELNGVRALNVV